MLLVAVPALSRLEQRLRAGPGSAQTAKLLCGRQRLAHVCAFRLLAGIARKPKEETP